MESKEKEETIITPRMVRAGVDALVRLGWSLDGEPHESIERAVCDAYEAMVKAKE